MNNDLRNYSHFYKAGLIKFIYQYNVDAINKESAWPYLSSDSVKYLRDQGLKVLMLNAPSFDSDGS